MTVGVSYLLSHQLVKMSSLEKMNNTRLVA